MELGDNKRWTTKSTDATHQWFAEGMTTMASNGAHIKTRALHTSAEEPFARDSHAPTTSESYKHQLPFLT